MPYSFQTFSVGQVLTAAQVNQIEVNIRDHSHGAAGVNNTFVAPVLGAATATSINKVAITAPATSATLTIADGKTLTASNTLTFTGTDSSSVAFGAGGTVAYTETGTWTPSAGGNATYGVQQGIYVRNGAQWTCWCRLNIAVLGTGSSGTVNGLPATNDGATQYGGCIYFWTSLAITPVVLAPHVVGSNTTFIFEGATAAAATLSGVNPLGDGAGFYGMVTFRA